MNDPVQGGGAIAASAALLRHALDSDLLNQPGRGGPAIELVYSTLHAYLQAVCDSFGRVRMEPEPGITELFEWLREHHSALRSAGGRQAEVEGVLTALCSALDTLCPVCRPSASAEGGERMAVAESEASLAIDAARAVFVYVDSMLQSYDAAKGGA